MTLLEAKKVAKEWLAFCERQRQKTIKIQSLAALARTGPEGQKQAKKELAQIDRTPTVFGGDLRAAVEILLDEADHP